MRTHKQKLQLKIKVVEQTKPKESQFPRIWLHPSFVRGATNKNFKRDLSRRKTAIYLKAVRHVFASYAKGKHLNLKERFFRINGYSRYRMHLVGESCLGCRLPYGIQFHL